RAYPGFGGETASAAGEAGRPHCACCHPSRSPKESTDSSILVSPVTAAGDSTHNEVFLLRPQRLLPPLQILDTLSGSANARFFQVRIPCSNTPQKERECGCGDEEEGADHQDDEDDDGDGDA
nr:hypothetical protein [Tanacetum cinerariifolium]